MEQIDQLASAGQISEALASLKRLIDQSLLAANRAPTNPIPDVRISAMTPSPVR